MRCIREISEEFLTSLLHEDSLDVPEHLKAVQEAGPKLDEALNAPIPYEGRFAQDVLSKVPEFKWLKGVKCNLVHNDTNLSDREFLSNFLDKLLKKSKLIDGSKMGLDEDLPMIAIDLETTGLDTSIKLIGGKIHRNTDLVGICLALNGKEGYYLPIGHTEEDGIKNLDYQECIFFLQDIVDNFFQIYHNAFYDMEAMSIHRIEMNTNYADTLLIANNLGMREWDDVFSLGLKFLSGYLLDRKMLEINELMGQKAIIKFNRLASKDAVVYGCSDAMNTFELFNEMVLKARDYDNPYMYNRLAMQLDTKVLNHLRGMFRHGLPLDYKVARGNFKTLINRLQLFQSYFYSYEITEGYNIGSAEQVNMMFGLALATPYLARYDIAITENMDWNNKRVMACKKALYEDFGLELKIKKLKNSQKLTFATRKMGNTGVKVLEWIKANIDKWDFLDEGLRDDIYWLANIVDKYRSMVTEIGRLGKMLRYVYNDDVNISRFGIALRINGADCVIKGTKVKVRYWDCDDITERRLDTFNKKNRYNMIEEILAIENLEELLKMKKKVEIYTPDGWQQVTDFIVKKDKPCYMIELENGLSCGGAEQHLFQQPDKSFIFIRDLQVGTVLLTEKGASKVISKKFIGVQDVYDITVNHKNHRYFSNGISSHNTSRFSNMSGKGSSDRMEINITKTGRVNTKFHEGDGIAGINAQGVPATGYKVIKAKKMLVLPETMIEHIIEKEFDVDKYYTDLLVTKLVKKG